MLTRHHPSSLCPGLISLALMACSPGLNWRELQPEGAALRLMFPCKPETEVRHQPGPAGSMLAVHALSCRAQAWQFTLVWMDVGDPALVSAVLQRMGEGPARQLQPEPEQALALAVAGMTPQALARQQHWRAAAGQAPLSLRQAVFAYGTQVYQLQMLGERDNAAAWASVLGGVRLGPAR